MSGRLDLSMNQWQNTPAKPAGDEAGSTSMRAYVLVEAAMGKADSVAAGVKSLEGGTVRLVSADVVTGPFDVIVRVETDDLDVLARWVTERIQAIDGVQRTITCVA